MGSVAGEKVDGVELLGGGGGGSGGAVGLQPMWGRGSG